MKKPISIILIISIIVSTILTLTACNEKPSVTTSVVASSTSTSVEPTITGETYPDTAESFSSDVVNSIIADCKKASIDWTKYKGTTVRMVSYSSVSMANLTSTVKGFKQLTGIDVQVDTVASKDLNNKILLEFNSGSPADIIILLYSNMPQYIASNWIDPISDYVNNPKLTDKAWYAPDDLIKTGVEYLTTKNVWYGIPFMNEVQIMFYNKDMYQQKGLKVPTTMDELYANAKALNTADVAGFVSRFNRDGNSSWVFSGIVRNYGGYIIDPDGKVTINTPELKKAAQMYVKLMKETAPAGVLSYTYAEEQTAFMGGKAAQSMDSSSFLATYESAATSKIVGKVGYAAIPTGITGQPSVANCNYTGLGISKAGKNKEAAWLFIQFVTNKTFAKNFGVKRAQLFRNSAISDPAVMSKYPADWLQAVGNAKTDKNATILDVNASTILEEVMVALQNIYDNQNNIDKILADTQKKVEGIVTKK